VYRSATIRLEDDSLIDAVGPSELAIHKGDFCVTEFRRVPEFGQVVQLTDQEGPLPPRGTVPVVVRRATLQDQARARENSITGRMASKTVHKRVEDQKLDLRVLHIRYSFDRSVLHVTFTSEERVEYTDLVKSLAGDLKVRIEMKSLGVRDAAKAVGGMGVCGRSLCCKAWIKDFEVVTVKMAKTQRLALNPAAISGMCGRLKCCLKYEFDNYRKSGETLPRDGAKVRCGDGCGCVWDKDVMRQRVKVRLEDGRILDYAAEDVKPMAESGPHGARKQEEESQ
jgi:cell fate regulator YaaT (PSP1 superfamily)